MAICSGKLVEKESVEWFGAFWSFGDGDGGGVGRCTNRSLADWLVREFHVRILVIFPVAHGPVLPKYTARPPPDPLHFLADFLYHFRVILRQEMKENGGAGVHWEVWGGRAVYFGRQARDLIGNRSHAGPSGKLFSDRE
jgi:hypothetical protein